MTHSEAKRYAVSMVLKRIERDLVDLPNRNFMPEMNDDDRQKVESCLQDLRSSLWPRSLTKSDFESIGFIAKWLKKEE